MYMYIYMVEVRSAAFVGVRDTFFDEPTDWVVLNKLFQINRDV